MPLWYVGREANRQQPWIEGYRAILRTIDSLPPADGGTVRVIRRSKAVQGSRRWGGREEFWLYVCVDNPSVVQARRIAQEIFEYAEQRYRVGFGPIFPPTDTPPGFLESTEYPTDGRIPPEPPREEEDVTGPFAYVDSLPAEPMDTAAMDRLLVWLSAAGEGRWETFVRAAVRLGAAADTPAARRLFRRMLLLGHLESSQDGLAWSVAPPVIVQTAADPSVVFWCGSRTDALRRTVPSTWRLADEANWSGTPGPSPLRFVVPGAGAEASLPLPPCTLPPTWSALSWGGPVADRLAPLLPDLQEWSEALERLDWIPPPSAAEVWDLAARSFRDEPAFRVPHGGVCTGPPGLYRLTFGDPPRTYQLTVLYDPHAHAGAQMLRGEWYGLRFLALHRAGKYRKAVWRPEDRTLAILHSQRWPLLYERALVLASGLLPRRDGAWLLYAEITKPLATTLAGHLGVTLESAAPCVTE